MWTEVRKLPLGNEYRLHDCSLGSRLIFVARQWVGGMRWRDWEFTKFQNSTTSLKHCLHRFMLNISRFMASICYCKVVSPFFEFLINPYYYVSMYKHFSYLAATELTIYVSFLFRHMLLYFLPFVPLTLISCNFEFWHGFYIAI